MDIKDKATAREFIRVWRGWGSRGDWFMAEAAESQRACANLAGPDTLMGRRHIEAAEVLEAAFGEQT